MPYVLKHKTGEYLKGKNAWSTTLTPRLADARVYSGKGAAKNSRTRQGRYNRRPVEDLDVVEVILVEVPKEGEQA